MRILLFIIFVFLMSCTKKSPVEVALSNFYNAKPLAKIKDTLEKLEVQIMLSDANNTYTFLVDDTHYFYPASTVKFPVALLALEKINQFPQLTSETLFQVQGDSIKTTIRKEVQKIFAVSDNAAYNRLFEFLGVDYINEQLKSKGLKPIQISHRLATNDAANPTTKELLFFANDIVIHHQKSMVNTIPKTLTLEKIHKGKGYYKNGALVNQPMDFSKKNYLPISTLHELMNRIHFPERYAKGEIFDISESDNRFLLKTMHKTPQQQGYLEKEYYDSYAKFFLFGDTKAAIPNHIKIYNKVGYAYGYLTDCAYIVDEKAEISFVLTATIHVNKNRIFNDDNYEYDSIGIPFLAALGKNIHAFYQQNR